MPKARVYELAKEFGVSSKQVLAKLKEMGEFVKSASSTVEPPVVRRLHQEFGKTTHAITHAKVAAKSARRPHTPVAHSASTSATPSSAQARHTAQPHSSASSASPRPAAMPTPGALFSSLHEGHESAANGSRSRHSARPSRAGARPEARSPRRDQHESPMRHEVRRDQHGMNPSRAHQGGRPGPHRAPRPGTPRPGNNPFTARQGMHFPTPADIPRPRPGKSSSPYRGGNRFHNARPGSRGGEGNYRNRWGHSSQSRNEPDNERSESRFGESRQGGGFRGRGRGGAAGAFGHQGSRSSRARRRSRERQQEQREEMRAPRIAGVRIPNGNGQTIRLRQGATLADLAEQIHVDPAALVTVLFHLGQMATANQSLDEDTFQILGEEIGWNIQIVSAEEEDKQLLEQFDINLDNSADEKNAKMVVRPPVVTVMGHVDHGKTRLLDTIRQTNVSAHEAGGITQRIGAYQVSVDLDGKKRKITFLDTPGHEAFTAMRARGAEITDIVVLVVAADDGVMPQTIEALNHAKAANVPIVVAVNKIDLPGADPQKVRNQLMQFGLVPEEYGGDTMFVDISAKQGTNVDKLLEDILLTADASLDLQTRVSGDAKGATIEARLDKGRGAVASIIVQEGTLHVGDPIVVGTAYGRVRAMLSENGRRLKQAGPSTPVQVLGLTSVPAAGDLFLVAPDDRSARQIAEKREAIRRSVQQAKRHKVVSLESLNEQFKKSEVDMLNLIIKGDSSGSVEALEDELMKIKVSDSVGISVIHRGVGAITQNDVNLAEVDKAVIIGFNVRPNRNVSELAEQEGVEIKFYTVIYNAVEEIQESLEGMLKPEFEEVETSHSQIRQIFRSSKFGNIAGVMVQDGVVKRGTKARITRNGVVTVNDLTITSLRRFKDDVNEVKAGFEAGINLGTFNDIQEGDIIETYENREIPKAQVIANEKAKLAAKGEKTDDAEQSAATLSAPTHAGSDSKNSKKK